MRPSPPSRWWTSSSALTAAKSLGQRRSRARRLALQALYQWQMAGQNLENIEAQFLSEVSGDLDVAYFRELLHGIPERLKAIDARLAPFLDRPIEQLDPIELALLRIGAYELLFRPDIPHKVAINEAVKLAKRFGAEGSYRYINGVLDKLAREARR